MGNSGSNKIHTKAESERMHDYNQASLQRVNPKVYNGGFKVLPERLPNQRLRSTDNGNLLHNGGTLSGRRPTSVGGFPDIPSSPQPPPLPPPLTEEELQQLLKKRHRLNNQQKQQQHRHSSVDISDGMFNRSNYIPESTQSNIDFRLSKPPVETAPKKKLFNRKIKAPIPPRFDDKIIEKEQKKANGKKDFANFFHSKRNSNVGGRETIDDNASYLLPPPSQFVSAEVVTAPKVHSVDKKSITYVLERREASVSPSSGHRSSLSGAERNHYVKRANSPPENKYNGRVNNHHHQLAGQLSDSAMQSSTLDRVEMRHRMSEPLQKRVQSMDSLVQKDVDIVPHGQLLPTTRDELKEKLTKMSKTINHSMDNIYLLSKNNINHEHSLPRKPSYLENKVDLRGRTDSFDTKQKMNKFEFGHQNNTQHNMNKNASAIARESFKLHETKTMENAMNKLHHGSKSGDDEVFESPADSRFNYKSSEEGSKMQPKGRNSDIRLSGAHQNRDSELVSEHVQDAFLAKTREAQSGVLEYNRKLGTSKNNQKKAVESSQNHATPLDVSSEDDMDIDMQLRPTLPKRHHAVPRFSPTHVWRSLVIDTEGGRKYDDRASDHSSDAEEEGDIYEDRIQRVARPVAPPKTINEKSADSGISPGAVSPLPVSYDFEINDKITHNNKTNTTSSSPSSKLPRSSSLTKNRSLAPTAKDKFSHNPPRESSTLEKKNAGAAWTPEEDLASDFDAGSGDIPVVISELRHNSDWDLSSKPEMISSHPKLTTRKNMFGQRSHPIVSEEHQKLANKMVVNEDELIQPAPAPQTFNSVRKLKRSLSGVLQTNIKNRLTAAPTNGEPASAESKHKSLDDNWSLSRSLPNSLHNGHEGEKLVPYKNVNKTPEVRSKTKESEKVASQNSSSYFDHSAAMSNYHFQPRLNRSESGPIFFGGLELSSLNPAGSASYIPSRPFIDLEGRTFNANHRNNSSGANNRVMYLPKYEAMQIIDEKQAIKPQRKAYSDLGMSKHPNNNNMQMNTVVNNAHNGGSAQVQKKGKKGKKFTYQSTVRQLERRQLEQQLSREVALEEKRRAEEVALVNKVEEEFQKKRDREKVSIRQQLRILNLKDDDEDDNYEDEDDSNDQEDDENEGANYKQVPELQSLPWNHSRNHFSQSYEMDGGPLSLPVQPSLHIPPVDYESKANRNYNNDDFHNREMPSQPSSGKFFGGISRWMKKQPAKEEYDSKNHRRTEQLSRLEPEGAPSSLTVHDGGNPRQPSPQQESRGRAIVGAKFSSGRSPDMSYGAAKKTNIYSHLAQVAAKEKLLQKTGNSEKDSRTSVWLSPDNTYPSPTSPSKIAVNGNATYYPTAGPFESLPSSNNINGMPRDFHYYPHTGPSSMPYDVVNHSNKRADDNRYSHGKVSNPQDWRLNGGQRHSIAIDTSSNSSRSGGEWVSDAYRNPVGKNGGGKEKNRSSNNAQNHKNERLSINTYQDYNPNGPDQRNKQNIIGLNSNQRSLSFSHIPAINKDEPIRSSRIPVPTLVQPFNPNKAYRPVPFYTTNSYENRK